MADQVVAGDGGAPAAPPPRADDLMALPADLWGRLLPHIRASLHDVDEQFVTRRVRRLRAAPTSRLAGGRVRRELADLLAGGGPVWRTLVKRLQDDPPEGAGWLVEGERPAAAPRRPPRPAPEPDLGERHERELERLRERARQLQDARDRALRQARGAEVRADALEEDLDRMRARLERADERIGELESELREAGEELERVVERERRRADSQLSELREELRDHRRAAQRRRKQELQRKRAAEAARQREHADEPAPDTPVAGRPTSLPAGIRPGTVEAAALLLQPGRLVLVDGYNVTRTHRDQVDLEQQRAWLVRLVEGLVARRRVQAEIVFDGQGEGSASATSSGRGLRVRFTGPGLSADDDIEFTVAALPPERPVVVVTDDRELATRIREHRGDVIGTRPFLSVAE